MPPKINLLLFRFDKWRRTKALLRENILYSASFDSADNAARNRILACGLVSAQRYTSVGVYVFARAHHKDLMMMSGWKSTVCCLLNRWWITIKSTQGLLNYGGNNNKFESTSGLLAVSFWAHLCARLTFLGVIN